MSSALDSVARESTSLEETAHRPWPAPKSMWLLGQSWLDLLAPPAEDKEKLEGFIVDLGPTVERLREAERAASRNDPQALTLATRPSVSSRKRADRRLRLPEGRLRSMSMRRAC
jgi:hypothetical protein